VSRHDDPVSSTTRAYVLRRDRRCVVGILALAGEIADPGPCTGRFGRPIIALIVDEDDLTIAHVRDRAGGRVGKRPPSTMRRLATVCWGHHIADPVVDRRAVREAVDAYLEALEGPDIDDDRPWEAIRRVRARGVDSSTSEPEGGLGGSR